MGCRDCSRRSVLHGLAIGTAGALLGCGSRGTSQPDAPIDAGVDPVSMCGTNVCVDVTAAPALAQVNGSLVVTDPTNSFKVMLVRTSDTAFVTVSDVCTHAGCFVGYDATLQLLVCPCHGSEFDLTGAVKRGPANRPLTNYANSYDTTSQVLTITVT
jgi:Rieske Fe-S protein